MSWTTVFVFTSIFGHTIGHAIEATAGYGKVMHGEAVTMGMVQISKVAEEKGLMPAALPSPLQICVRNLACLLIMKTGMLTSFIRL